MHAIAVVVLIVATVTSLVIIFEIVTATHIIIVLVTLLISATLHIVLHPFAIPIGRCLVAIILVVGLGLVLHVRVELLMRLVRASSPVRHR